MPVTCARCDAAAEGADDAPDVDGAVPLGWSSTAAEGARHLCPACTRTHVRAIEAKLDEAWW